MRRVTSTPASHVTRSTRAISASISRSLMPCEASKCLRPASAGVSRAGRSSGSLIAFGGTSRASGVLRYAGIAAGLVLGVTAISAAGAATNAFEPPLPVSNLIEQIGTIPEYIGVREAPLPPPPPPAQPTATPVPPPTPTLPVVAPPQPLPTAIPAPLVIPTQPLPAPQATQVVPLRRLHRAVRHRLKVPPWPPLQVLTRTRCRRPICRWRQRPPVTPARHPGRTTARPDRATGPLRLPRRTHSRYPTPIRTVWAVPTRTVRVTNPNGVGNTNPNGAGNGNPGGIGNPNAANPNAGGNKPPNGNPAGNPNPPANSNAGGNGNNANNGNNRTASRRSPDRTRRVGSEPQAL